MHWLSHHEDGELVGGWMVQLQHWTCTARPHHHHHRSETRCLVLIVPGTRG